MAAAPASSSSADAGNMKALYITQYAEPTEANEKNGVWTVGILSRPTISRPYEMLIRVHAASINPVDWKLAEGKLKAILKHPMPCKLGYDVSGVVVSLGNGVTKFKVGDVVMSRVAAEHKGTIAEYTLADEGRVVLKPKNLTHAQAACIPLAGITALQVLRKGTWESRLPPRTVFLQGPLGGTGAMAVQLAQHHFKIERILVSVSGAKLPRAQELFGGDKQPAGTHLEFLDYKKEDPAVKYRGQVDFVFDSGGDPVALFPMMKPLVNDDAAVEAAPASVQPNVNVISKTVSIATAPDGDQAAGFGAPPPWLVKQALNLMDWNLRRKAKRAGGEYSFWLLQANAADLQILADLAEAGHLNPVIGKTYTLEQSVQAFRDAEAGAIDGKAVIQVIPEQA